ncbi:MAG: NAD(P)H-dependent oxidoreductase [Chrysiogenetes bacterium]|nr:NAD(P)H-dependent oxidoreductase [Chrysiogenetes bacterium]
MDLMNALEWRYAVRKFSDEVLSEMEVAALLDVTRLSASSYGLQPYRLLVVESPDIRRELVAHSYGQEKVAACSHLIVFAVQTNIGDALVDEYVRMLAKARGVSSESLQAMAGHIKEALAAKSPEENLQWAHQQAHIALGNLLTSAAMMGIDTCPMGGFDAAGYDRVLGLAKENLTASVICPIGRRDAGDEAAAAPKVRRDYEEIVMVR